MDREKIAAEMSTSCVWTSAVIPINHAATDAATRRTVLKNRFLPET
ncbi:hypothetical protein [Streptomyces mirabilis]